MSLLNIGPLPHSPLSIRKKWSLAHPHPRESRPERLPEIPHGSAELHTLTPAANTRQMSAPTTAVGARALEAPGRLGLPLLTCSLVYTNPHTHIHTDPKRRHTLPLTHRQAQLLTPPGLIKTLSGCLDWTADRTHTRRHTHASAYTRTSAHSSSLARSPHRPHPHAHVHTRPRYTPPSAHTCTPPLTQLSARTRAQAVLLPFRCSPFPYARTFTPTHGYPQCSRSPRALTGSLGARLDGPSFLGLLTAFVFMGPRSPGRGLGGGGRRPLP